MLLSQLSLPSDDLSAGCDFLFLPVAAASHLLLKALQANALRKTLVNLLFVSHLPAHLHPPFLMELL